MPSDHLFGVGRMIVSMMTQKVDDYLLDIYNQLHV